VNDSSAPVPLVFVTGGSGFVGRAVVAALAQAGARVVFTYLTGEAAARALEAAHPGCQGVQVDLRDQAALRRSVDEAAASANAQESSFVAYVHAAGVGTTGADPKAFDPLATIDEAGFDRLFAVNVKSAFFGAQAACAHFRAPAGGNVVFVSSIDGVKAVPAPVHYGASKGALAGMVKVLAKEVGPKNVRVTAVAPGVLEGGLSHALPAELRAEYLRHTGLKRLGKAEEVAAVIVQLALRNTYLTGQTLVIDGGL
jgi:NAD(P)-dependent dehydrogenase (short-subunit alcohol dehydrogenase family)